MLQNKQKEIDFFNELAEDQAYNVFTDVANQKIIDKVSTLLALTPGAQVVDFGCGSGIFTGLLQQRGYQCLGLDLSQKLLIRGKKEIPSIGFLQADVESLPFANDSIDAIMLSCLIHHLPDPTRCIQEVYRVLKPQGRFVAFDPNRLNPFMYLYRDKSSPFYNANGVTENERPILAHKVRGLFQQAGFATDTMYVDGLSYRYVASSTARNILPIYNFIDHYCFKPSWMKKMRAFVFTYGIKIIA